MDVSFIIPLYNCLPLTRACLASLEETLRHIRCEILLVDDGSTDGTREFLATLQSPYRIILNDANLGYAASNNRAARCARAPILCLLNNDTVVTPVWLEPMMALLESSEDVGLVGNIHVNRRMGFIDHAGVFFDLDGHPEHAHRGRRVVPRGLSSERNSVGAACWLVRRSTFLGFGGFDEAFQNGYEDVDLCVRLRLAGYRLLVSHQSKIYHWVGSSPTRALRDRGNRELFLRRWSGITSIWGRQEWPTEYLRCHARRWWRANTRKLLLAVWLLAHDRRSSDRTRWIP